MKVLIVEDESLLAIQTANMLKEVGFTEMLVCNCRNQVLSLAQDYKPDLIVMDYSLKDKSDGIMVSGEIKKILDIPVIFIAADAPYGNLSPKEKSYIPGKKHSNTFLSRRTLKSLANSYSLN
jgi:CheY-like chemotaxis protein